MSQDKLSKCEQSGTEPAKIIFSEEKLRSLILKMIRAVFIPSSVYRIQLNRDFTFKHVTVLVPYLKELGIGAVYCSPYFQAVPGSMHGYNVTDPNSINPEIGTPEEYANFCDALAKNDMGHILDVVPNHMGVMGKHNRWWLDVLENGLCSFYAQYFDIDWKPTKQELWGKVLLPVLGDFYGKVLENQEIQVIFQNGGFTAFYHDHCFPIDPKTYAVILEDDIDKLVKDMGQENQDYSEYLSVITAFKNLPPASECLPEKIIERSREKEIAKRRLAALTERSEKISSFIEERVRFFNGNKDDPKSFDALDHLLNLQSYRLAFWSVASQEINYRRFFDINELGAIRTEDEKVFKAYHETLYKLIREGKVNGLRIDHPDGLYDPSKYFIRLQREYLLQMILKESEEEFRKKGEDFAQIDEDATRETLEHLLANEFSSLPAFYVVAEKILGSRESLPENWSIHGTVGYEFLNALNGLFVDAKNQEAFGKLYESYIGHTIDFDELAYNKKKFFGLVPMASEINALGHRLDRISETNRNYRDFTRNDLTVAIREVIAGFSVYRTYVSPDSTSVSERDEKYICAAVEKARAKTPALNPAVYDFLKDVLLLRVKIEAGSDEANLYKDFVLRFQQLTGPIMAKGVEDTSFYVYNRLLSLNEVGGDPFCFGCTRKKFHQQNIERNKRWPCGMINSSTHDTKRSEDVRMRINVLSEIPEEWKLKINEWGELNRQFKTAIDGIAEPRPNTEYFIYQTLIGAWPDEDASGKAMDSFIERIWQYVLKAIREAKIYTSWSKPDTAYEEAVNRFIKAILTQSDSNHFLKTFLPFQKKISFFGKLNGLSATLLKIASPGVVDIYQGNEMWCYNLVDPDNRRHVDFESRIRLLNTIRKEFEVNKSVKFVGNCFVPDNFERLKFLYTWMGLQFRRQHKELFVGGEYLPMEVKGKRERNVVAFIRRRGKKIALIVAGRFFTQWPVGKASEPSSDFWKGTELIWPKDLEFPAKLRDIMTSDTIDIVRRKQSSAIKVSDLFRQTCACLLINNEEQG
ncbi:MAG: malto-oligosyltrehalose synthase [Proteobacteria bacterium]|nr:malto-oligosyltrehalose synthase [Pseudomonadota bacterium]